MLPAECQLTRFASQPVKLFPDPDLFGRYYTFPQEQKTKSLLQWTEFLVSIGGLDLEDLLSVNDINTVRYCTLPYCTGLSMVASHTPFDWLAHPYPADSAFKIQFSFSINVESEITAFLSLGVISRNPIPIRILSYSQTAQ